MSDNKFKNEITVSINGTEYKLRATFNALVGIENRTGLSLPRLAQNFGQGDVKATWLFDIIDEGLKGAKSAYDVNQLKDDIAAFGTVQTTLALTPFFAAALYGGEDKKNEVQ